MIKKLKKIFPAAAVLLALAMLVTVFAQPDILNNDRWPDPTNHGEDTLVPGFGRTYYISTNKWKTADYTKITFSNDPGTLDDRLDEEGNCYFNPRKLGILYQVPVPSGTKHEEGGENGFLADLSFPTYEAGVNPTRNNSTGEYMEKISEADIYYPVRVNYQFEYGGVTREVPWYVIGYREEYKATEADLSKYLSQASQFAEVMKQLSDMMKEIEAKDAGEVKAGDYHPIYDYMLNDVYQMLGNSFAVFESNIEWTKTNAEQAISDAIAKRNVRLEAEQMRALIRVAREYIALAEENRISEPEIVSFTLGGYPGQIDQESGIVTVYFPEGADEQLLKQEPVIVTPKWTKCELKSGSLAEGSAVYHVAAYDGTSTITYDGKKAEYYEFWGDVQRDYTVKVIQGNPETQVTGVTASIGEESFEASIEGEVITLKLPSRLDTEGQKASVKVFHNGTSAQLLDGSGKPLTGTAEGNDYNEVLLSDLKNLKKIHIEDNIYELMKDYTVQLLWTKSSEAKILEYRLGGYAGEIDETNRKITVKVPYGKDISGFTEEVTVSPYASWKRDASFQNWEFDTPVTYQVTAEDGTTAVTYQVTVTEGTLSESCEITSFTIGKAEGVIDQTAGTIQVTVSADTNLKLAAPVIGLSEGAKVSPASEETVDLTNPVTYTVTGASGNTKVYTVTAVKESGTVDEELKKRANALVEKIIARYRTSADDDWEFMNLGFYDHKKREPGDAFPANFDLEEQVTSLARNKMTDYDRGIMMLTALGIDCTRLDEYNGGTPILHSSGVDLSNLVAELYNYPEGDTINGPVFFLNAMNMGNYSIPADAKYTEETMLNTILNHQYGSDGFGIDMVAMIMQSLYPYRDMPAVQAKLQEGLQIILGEKVVDGVKGMQDDYSFYSTGTYNSEAVSQVICALCSMGIDPATDPRFSDGTGRSVFSVWMEMFANETDGYFHHDAATKNDAMATYQACYALQWYLGFLENGGSGHPYSLYADGFNFGSDFSAEAKILSFTLEGKQGVINEAAKTVQVELPTGVSLSGLTPELTLSDGAKLLSPTLPYNFVADVATPFAVQAEDGETTEVYMVTVTQSDGVLSSGTSLKAETIDVQDVNQRTLTVQEIGTKTADDGVTEITITMGPDADLTKLRLYAEISEKASASVSLEYKAVLDLSDWLTVTITAEDGTTKDYRIKAVQNTYASIAAFSVDVSGKRYDGTIDNSTNQIVINGVPSNADVTALVPNITLSEGTTGCIPLAGQAQDFSSPVKYTVTGVAAGLTARTYTVTVVKNGTPVDPGETTSAAITEFVIQGYQGVINNSAGTIVVTMPIDTDVTALIPTITTSGGASVYPLSGSAVNLSAPVTYTVTNSLGSRTYTVSVVLERTISDQLWDALENNNTIKDQQYSYDHSYLSGGGSSGSGSGSGKYDQYSKDNSWLSR